LVEGGVGVILNKGKRDDMSRWMRWGIWSRVGETRDLRQDLFRSREHQHQYIEAQAVDCTRERVGYYEWLDNRTLPQLRQPGQGRLSSSDQNRPDRDLRLQDSVKHRDGPMLMAEQKVQSNVTGAVSHQLSSYGRNLEVASVKSSPTRPRRLRATE
jgi:hypothetical protein